MEFPRHNTRYKVRFGGRVQQEGAKARWLETEEIVAIAYDQVIPGFDTDATNTLRLRSAQASNEINLGKFNQAIISPQWRIKTTGERVARAVSDDSTSSGRELRLRQEELRVGHGAGHPQPPLADAQNLRQPRRTRSPFTSTTLTRCCRFPN